MSDRDSFYISILIIGTLVFFWIVAAICLDGQIPYFFCPFKYIFGIQCPFCGLTHACAYLFRGNVEAALSTAPLVMVLSLMLAYPLVIFDVITDNNLVYSVCRRIYKSIKIGLLKLYC